MRVEQFTAKRDVEAFDVGILRRLAGLNPVQGNALGLVPLAQPSAVQLQAIIRAQLEWAGRSTRLGGSAP